MSSPGAMFGQLDRLVPRAAIELALFLAFLVGLEREEHKTRVAHYGFGGIRTFPLLAFVGYGLARLSGGDVLSLAIGFAVVGAFMIVSYHHKLTTSATAGVTTEISGLLVYVIGALVYRQAYWVAVALGIVAVLLLELKEALEKLTRRIAPDQVVAFTKFLLLSAVILPILPNRPFSEFAINPYKTWLVIVAVSGISYASYVLQHVLHGRGGVIVTGLLGGAYSSTATTVVLARRSKEAHAPWLYAGSTLAASGTMYLRLVVLVLVVDPGVAGLLAPWFCVLGAVAMAAGGILARRGPHGSKTKPPAATKNPLELGTALLFGAVFVTMLVLTRLAMQHLGRGGLYVLGGLSGLVDVDPYAVSVSQSATGTPAAHTAAVGVALAAASNNLVKGAYAMALGERKAGRTSLALLSGLALLGLSPVLWL